MSIIDRLENLTDEQCSNLNCGDIVIHNPEVVPIQREKNKHFEYFVSYKSNLKLNLTYVGTDAISKVVYNYTNNEWVYGNVICPQ